MHRLLLVVLKRRREDDRDHYANKRLDLGGPLLAGLFRWARSAGAYRIPPAPPERCSGLVFLPRAGRHVKLYEQHPTPPRTPDPRLLFRKLCKDIRSYVQRAVDAGKEVRRGTKANRLGFREPHAASGAANRRRLSGRAPLQTGRRPGARVVRTGAWRSQACPAPTRLTTYPP